MSQPSRIRVLPPELADQIAAGEVVERPASVVKELAENALDAGARRIEIEVEGGGLGLIAVSDDGSGMTPDEAHLALKRHATSKLTAIDDLFTIESMGFRGEALPSIAAVSTLTLTTRARDAEGGGYQIVVEGGVGRSGRAVGAPAGTRVEVRELLANVPARLKFMRGEATESAHIAEAVLRLALANPTVHFRLRSDGRLTHDLPPHASALERARVALGRGKTPAKLHENVADESGVAVAALLGSPADAANTSRGTYLYVNRRFVRDRSLLHSVVLGYGDTLERGRYPLAVVHVTLPGRALDVNVHPQKLEVRFARAQEVYAAVRHTVARGVGDAPWLPSTSRIFARQEPLGYAERRARAEEAMRMFAPPPESLFAQPPPVAAVEPEPAGFFASLTFLAQLHRTYLLCQAPGELVLVDQHAASERVAFARLGGAIASQRLLLPVSVEVEPELAAAAPLLSSLGFELERFGDATVVVRALPAPIASADAGELVPEALACAGDPDRVRATIACRAATRAGDAVSADEARALLAALDGVDVAAHRPHGRPVHVRLSLGEIERRFR